MKKSNIVALALAAIVIGGIVVATKGSKIPEIATTAKVEPESKLDKEIEKKLPSTEPVINSTVIEEKITLKDVIKEKEVFVEPEKVKTDTPMVVEAVPPITVKASPVKADPTKDKALPKAAPQHFEMLREVVDSKWHGFHTPSLFAAQIEKETCKSLTHSTCWTTKAELKTKREYGFGFGQLTITYDAMGKVRFNKFEEVKRMDASLKDWEFVDRYDAHRQMIALVVLNRYNYQALKGIETATETDKIALTLAAYNGGLGGVLSEVRLCRVAKNCDPMKWFGNIETTTNKSKTRESGYGNSFADINRMYPYEILYTRRTKYVPYFEDTLIHPKLAVAPHRF